jgi:pimeloyl-ACP methyl ester carboxylesterase
MTSYHTVHVDGLDIFYRRAGSSQHPTILLLHGALSSSHMFRRLIPALAGQFHLVAPDLPGFGNSSMPGVAEFDYTFAGLTRVMRHFVDAIGLDAFSMYLTDHGAPIGYRIAVADPDRVESLIIQNGNAYDEGLGDFWDPIKNYWADPSVENSTPIRALFTPEATRSQYINGVRDVTSISPDNWNIHQPLLDRPGNDAIQLALFDSYASNLPLYADWQRYFRERQPPALIVWGSRDAIYPPAGAFAYQRDLIDLELHLLDTGHFVLEEDLEAVVGHMRRFILPRSVRRSY